MTLKSRVHRYIGEQMEGFASKKADACPYAYSDLGKRCAWLAGHFDRWGVA